jgi:hypothetical protein
MKKNTLKRLPLHRETLLCLSKRQELRLEQVQGGALNSTFCSWGSCDTDYCNIQTQ